MEGFIADLPIGVETEGGKNVDVSSCSFLRLPPDAVEEEFVFLDEETHGSFSALVLTAAPPPDSIRNRVFNSIPPLGGTPLASGEMSGLNRPVLKKKHCIVIRSLTRHRD